MQILNDLNAPYNAHAGTLLHFVRSCSLGSSDIDLALDATWWKEHASEVLEKFEDVDFEVKHTLGKMGQFGFEQSFVRNKIKVPPPSLCTASAMTVRGPSCSRPTRLEKAKHGNKIASSGGSGIQSMLSPFGRRTTPCKASRTLAMKSLPIRSTSPWRRSHRTI